jgi:hypothetical protein
VISIANAIGDRGSRNERRRTTDSRNSVSIGSISALCGKSEEDWVSAEDIARVLAHPQGSERT